MKLTHVAGVILLAIAVNVAAMYLYDYIETKRKRAGIRLVEMESA
jgi:hypothetical protein